MVKNITANHNETRFGVYREIMVKTDDSTTNLIKVIFASLRIEDGWAVAILTKMTGSYQSIAAWSCSATSHAWLGKTTYHCFQAHRQQGPCDHSRVAVNGKLAMLVV